MFKNPTEILDALKEKRLKVAKLSTETGIPSSRIYKWKDRGSKITSEDADKLKEWIERLDNSIENGGRPAKDLDLITEVRSLMNWKIEAEVTIVVLKQTVINLIASAGKSAALVSAELDEAIEMGVRKHRGYG